MEIDMNVLNNVIIINIKMNKKNKYVLIVVIMLQLMIQLCNIFKMDIVYNNVLENMHNQNHYQNIIQHVIFNVNIINKVIINIV